MKKKHCQSSLLQPKSASFKPASYIKLDASTASVKRCRRSLCDYNRPSGDKGLQKSIQSANLLRVLGSCRQKGGPGYQKGSPAHQNAQKCNMFARCFQQISNVFLSQFLMTRSTSVTKTSLVYPPISPVSQQKKPRFSPTAVNLTNNGPEASHQESKIDKWGRRHEAKPLNPPTPSLDGGARRVKPLCQNLSPELVKPGSQDDRLCRRPSPKWCRILPFSPKCRTFLIFSRLFAHPKTY